jgi:hypothetical protein
VLRERLGESVGPIDEGERLHLPDAHRGQPGEGAVGVRHEVVVHRVELDGELRLGHR